MSHFACPLCGLNRSIASYDPSEYSDDIMICTFRSKGYRMGFHPPDKESISNFDMDDLLELIVDRILDLYFLYCEEEEDDAEESDEHEERQDRLLQAINYEVQDAYPKGFNTIFQAALALLKVHRRYKLDEEDDEEDEYEAQDIEDGEMYDPAADSRKEEEYRNMSDLDRELLRAERELAREDTPL